jgi:hypothetical protein
MHPAKHIPATIVFPVNPWLNRFFTPRLAGEVAGRNEAIWGRKKMGTAGAIRSQFAKGDCV